MLAPAVSGGTFPPSFPDAIDLRERKGAFTGTIESQGSGSIRAAHAVGREAVAQRVVCWEQQMAAGVAMNTGKFLCLSFNLWITHAYPVWIDLANDEVYRPDDVVVFL